MLMRSDLNSSCINSRCIIEFFIPLIRFYLNCTEEDCEVETYTITIISTFTIRQN